MDGRTYGTPQPSYYGPSVGHWEGQSLIVDTVGLLAQTDLVQNVAASPLSHLQERITMDAPYKPTWTLTISDPKSFTAPCTAINVFIRHRDRELRDVWCDEAANRDATDAAGHEHLDLTPQKVGSREAAPCCLEAGLH